MLIRLANVNDAGQILDIYTPYVKNTTISFEWAVPSGNEMENRIMHLLENNPWIVLEENGVISGYAYASKHRERSAYRWSVDVSIYVRQDCHGRGIGKALYTSLFSLLRYQGYYNAYAGICLPNDRSIGIHEYFGFKKIAQYDGVGYKLGGWHDVGWWGLSLKEHSSQPKEPLPIREVPQNILDKAFEDGLKVLDCRGKEK